MSEYLIQGETLTDIANAIREKTGGTDPIPTSDMAGLIAAIEAGGGTRIVTGTVTFTEDVSKYNFLPLESGGDAPDMFLVWSESEGNPVDSERKGYWVVIRYKADKKQITFGQNHGTNKYYTPYVSTFSSNSKMCELSSMGFNSMLLVTASPYKWMAIWGV